VWLREWEALQAVSEEENVGGRTAGEEGVAHGEAHSSGGAMDGSNETGSKTAGKAK
jgi:hypothetical protein